MTVDQVGVRINAFHLHDGGTLRHRLVALVLVPILGLIGFATAQMVERFQVAAQGSRVQQVIDTTTHLVRANSALLAEQLPALARAAVGNPLIASVLKLDPDVLRRLGPTDANIAALRRDTDRDVAAVVADHRVASQLPGLQQTIASARSKIDSGIGLIEGSTEARAISDRLGELTTDQQNLARATGLEPSTRQALSDLSRAASVTQNAVSELTWLAATKLPSLAGVDPVTEYLLAWSGYQNAVATLTTSGAPQLAAAIRAALRTPGARQFDQAATRAAAVPAAVTVNQLLTMYQPSQQRATAIAGVLLLASQRATQAARAQRDDALTTAWTMAAITLAIVLGTLGFGLVLSRSLARPLGRLAGSARRVSEGELEDVPVGGPHEVRTAARGLAEAVANLRNIEAQAVAVAAGDLDSDVVRRPLPGALGTVMQASVTTIIDAICERDAARSDLAYRAAHDQLTELPNRAQAMLMIDNALLRARRAGLLTGLMFIDLDFFKTINDNFGHTAGDGVLRAAAARMTAIVRQGDMVARLGGDEFVVLVQDVPSEADFVALAQRIVDALAEPVDIEHRQVRIGASVGVAFCRDVQTDADRLLNDADAAAYRAKHSGRGRVDIFDDHLREMLRQRSELEAAIRSGLAAGEFVLHYQPVVELRTGRPTGVEALIRWDRPGHGLLSPGEFIPVAEKSTLINDIGRWTLLEATAELMRWETAPTEGEADLTVAVNVSGRHLGSATIVPDVVAALDASGLDPHRLVVEVTETVLVDDPASAANMADLRALGVRVAIDDFGTGYTSIGQLPRLPIDTIKIDRSFVASTEPAVAELVRLVAAAAHAFGLNVVAEGIEEADQLDRLSAFDIENGQGYLFARPAPAGRAAALSRMPSLPSPRRSGPRSTLVGHRTADAPAEV